MGRYSTLTARSSTQPAVALPTCSLPVPRTLIWLLGSEATPALLRMSLYLCSMFVLCLPPRYHTLAPQSPIPVGEPLGCCSMLPDALR